MVLTGETAEGNTREVKISGHRELLQDTHRMRCDLSLPKHWVSSEGKQDAAKEMPLLGERRSKQ